jgi:hypothetical protein
VTDDDPRRWIVVPWCGRRDYLHGNPHTRRGLMAAYCPHDERGYSVSKADIVEMSTEAAAWVDGFLRGNEPPDPLGENGLEAGDDHPAYRAWRAGTERFHETGQWPVPPETGSSAPETGSADESSRYVRFRSPDDGADVLLVVRRWDGEHLALFLTEDRPGEGPARASALLDDPAARAVVAAVTAFLGPARE